MLTHGISLTQGGLAVAIIMNLIAIYYGVLRPVGKFVWFHILKGLKEALEEYKQKVIKEYENKVV